MSTPSPRDRLDAALARIADPNGEGARACLTVYREGAKAAAQAADARAKAGISLGPLDGAIVSIKDLFDVAGEVTRAGSKLVAEEGKPAAEDAPIVRRLREASPTASPNALMIRLGDAALGRGGRLVDAVRAIGRGVPATEARPFSLPADFSALRR